MTDQQTTPSLEQRVQEVLDQEIRPALQMDGGDIQLVGVEGGEVQVRLRGACAGCPGAQMTLSMGVEQRLRELFPDVTKVIAV